MKASQHFTNFNWHVVYAHDNSKIVQEYARVLGEWDLDNHRSMLLMGVDNGLEESAYVVLVNFEREPFIEETVILGYDPVYPADEIKLIVAESNSILFSVFKDTYYKCEYVPKGRWCLDGIPMYAFALHSPFSFLPRKRKLIVSKVRN